MSVCGKCSRVMLYLPTHDGGVRAVCRCDANHDIHYDACDANVAKVNGIEVPDDRGECSFCGYSNDYFLPMDDGIHWYCVCSQHWS